MTEQIGVQLVFSDTGLDKISQDIAKVNKEISATTKQANTGFAATNTGVSSLTSSFSSLSSIVPIAAGALAGLSVADLALSAIQAAENLKKLKDSLARVSDGDVNVASAKFSELSKIANELGIKNNELIGTYTSLAARGFKPTGEELKKLIDIAKVSNKDINQLAEAVLDAQTGEFERLKEFGIKASKANGEVSFSFNGVTRTVKDTEEEINKAILSFGNLASIQGTAASQANGLEAAQNRLGNATDALLANVGSLSNGLASAFVGSVGEVIASVNDALFPTQALNREFQATLASVIETQNTVPNLTKRYDELKGKTSLTKKEQGELNSLVSELSALYPAAVGEIDKYGNALNVNTQIINSNNKAQKDRLLELTRLQIQEAENTLKSANVTAESTKKIRESGGKIERNEILSLVGITKLNVVGLAQATTDYSKALGEVVKTEQDLAKLKQLQAQLESGGTVTPLAAEKEKAKVKAAINKDDIDAAKKKADDLKKLVEKAQDDAAKANTKVGDTNEQIVTKQKELALSQLAEQEKEIKDLAKSLGKKIDVTKEFEQLRLTINEEFIGKLRNARQKDIETAFDVKEVTEPLKNSLNKIDFSTFKVADNKAIAKALLDPRGFDDQFKEVNKAALKGADELSATVKALVTTTDASLDKISDPLVRLKLKITQAFGIDDSQLSQIQETFSQLTTSIFAFYNAQNEAAIKANEDLIKEYDKRISVQEKALDIELQRQKEGSANNVLEEKDKLAKLQLERDAAEKEGLEAKKKAADAQLVQDGIQQASSLITTIANIYAGFSKIPIVGIILGVAAVGAMLLSFNAAKANARAATKLRHGGMLDGSSHDNGGIPLLGGKYEAEGGEWVVNKADSREQDPFIKRLNSGEFRGIDLNGAISRDNPLSKGVASSRATSKNSDKGEIRFIVASINQAIKEQTGDLILHDKTKTVIVPTPEGYMSITKDAKGNKRTELVKVK